MWQGCFFFHYYLQLQWPIELIFSHVCYFMHMLRYRQLPIVSTVFKYTTPTKHLKDEIWPWTSLFKGHSNFSLVWSTSTRKLQFVLALCKGALNNFWGLEIRFYNKQKPSCKDILQLIFFTEMKSAEIVLKFTVQVLHCKITLWSKLRTLSGSSSALNTRDCCCNCNI